MKIKAEIEVDIPDDWIDLCTKYSDLFMKNYCGYWARGYQYPWGWLVYELADDNVEFEKEPDHKHAIGCAETYTFLRGTYSVDESKKVLPEHWFYVDKEAAIQAYVEGVKRWGLEWYNNGDAERYDVVIQMALLGEVRYG